METSGQRAIHVPPGEGQMRWVVGDLLTFKIGGQDTDGAFALAEEVPPPSRWSSSSPAHPRRRDLPRAGGGGRVRGRRAHPLGERRVVYAPRGVLHSFRNVGTGHSRMAVIITPGGLEKFFEEVGEPVTDPSSPPEGPPDIERLIAVARKYGMEIPPPPA